MITGSSTMMEHESNNCMPSDKNFRTVVSANNADTFLVQINGTNDVLLPQSFSMHRSQGHEESSSIIEQDRIGAIRVPSGSGFRIMTPFPWKLHEILEDVKEKGLDWIVAWRSDGKAFQVIDQDNFQDIILPMYFRHNRYKSFQRQLYLYGFRALQVRDMSKGVFFHPSFVQNDRNQCSKIVRPKQKYSYKRPRRKSANKTPNTPPQPVAEPSSLERRTPSTLSGKPSMMIGSTFDPFSSERVYNTMTSGPVQCIGVVSGFGAGTVSLDSSSDLSATGRPGVQEAKTAPDGDDASSSDSRLSSRTSTPPSSQMFEGPIFSVSLEGSTVMNIGALSQHESIGPGPDFHVVGTPASAYIQDLQQFSDSIIGLFGSQSNITT